MQVIQPYIPAWCVRSMKLDETRPHFSFKTILSAASSVHTQPANAFHLTFSVTMRIPVSVGTMSQRVNPCQTLNIVCKMDNTMCGEEAQQPSCWFCSSGFRRKVPRDPRKNRTFNNKRYPVTAKAACQSVELSAFLFSFLFCWMFDSLKDARRR